MIRSSDHWTDIPVGWKKRRQIISNWCNYREPNSTWKQSNPSISNATSIPSNWGGVFDFKYQSLKGPLQAFAGDSTDPSNTALVGVRRSVRPDVWINLKALGVNSVSPIVDGDIQGIGWPLLWTQTDLGFRLLRDKLVKKIRLRAPGHPAEFRFAIRIPDSCTLQIIEGEGGSISILDANGARVLYSPSVYGTTDTNGFVRVYLLEDDPIIVNGKVLPVIKLVPNPADLSDYPIILDPTVQIMDAPAIEDVYLVASNANANYGNTISFSIYPDAFVSLLRVSTSSIPDGKTITAFRGYFYVSTGAGRTIYSYIVKDANTWVEGTGVGAQQAGSCCWNYAKYDTQAWAGSVGCRTSGTDFDADASPPSIVSVAGEYNTFTLKPEWATAWKAASRVNNGIVLLELTGSTTTIYSTEYGSNRPYFEVDYEESVSGHNSLIFWRTT